MSFGPLVILGSIGVLLFAAKASGSKPANAQGTPATGPNPQGGALAPQGDVAVLPVDDQVKVAEMIAALGYDSNGNLTGTTTPTIVQAATSYASELESRGFKYTGGALRMYAVQAAQHIPTSSVIPLGCVSVDLQNQINRALTMERDPVKLKTLAAVCMQGYNADPTTYGCLKPAADMLNALATQVEAQQVTNNTLSQINTVLANPTTPQAQPAPTPAVSTPGIANNPSLQNTVVAPSPAPAPQVTVKTPVQKAAEQMVSQLRSIQSGANVGKGKEDVSLIKRFQGLAGLTQDGKCGPGTLVAAAKAGQYNLPLVQRWPLGKAKATLLSDYKNKLRDIADNLTSQMDADTLRASADREQAQGFSQK